MDQAAADLAQPAPGQAGATGAPNSEAGWLTPHGPERPVLPAPVRETIVIEDDAGQATPILPPADGDAVGEMVPTTPPGLRTEPRASHRSSPYQALTSGQLEARQLSDSAYELFGYTSPFGVPLKAEQLSKLHCWARMDFKSDEPHGTASTGPAMSSVRWRRTIDYHTGDIIFEGPVIPEREPEECHHFSKPRDTITELWHRGARIAPTFASYDDGVHSIEPGWDGSPETFFTTSTDFYKVYANHLAKEVGDSISRPSDSESDDFDDMSQGNAMTRQEHKAQEKELHWRDIMNKPHDYIEEFVKATQKEANSFTEWKSLTPVPPSMAKKILEHPELRKRVITSRACYRDKNKGKPPLKAKTRVVARGNQDPDLRSLTRQAATPGRTSEMLIYMIYVSGANKKACRSKDEWFLWMGDATTAFLQGTQDVSERAGKLYLKAPRDPLIERAGVFRSELRAMHLGY